MQITKMSVERRHLALRSALEETLVKQMKEHPERFHRLVHSSSDYPSQFSAHMLDKLERSQVVSLNETVVGAMEKLGIKGIDSLYSVMKFTPPEAAMEFDPPDAVDASQKEEKQEQPSSPKPFRGC